MFCEDVRPNCGVLLSRSATVVLDCVCTDDEMRELLTMFYEDHLLTSEEDESDEDGGEGESSDDGVGDFTALDRALEESEHFNPDSPWVEFKDDKGKSYYYNSDTEKTSWKMPEQGISGYGEDEDSDEDDESDDSEGESETEDSDGDEDDGVEPHS